MTPLRRLLITAFGLALTASTAGAYYHFVHYTNRNAPFNLLREKFDLNALPNKTVTFFVSDTAATKISRNDLYPSALSAIREAARAWNGVETSDLRVAFGGIAASGTPQNTPGADIDFDEMDPLLLGYTVTNAPQNISSFGPNGAFVPITRPRVRLNRDLSNWSSASSPSFTEAFFLTVAHEMGHALGLQHTFTASLMSTEAAGRATSLYTPLTADDMAGISSLYPRGNFSQSTGSIAGRISFPNGQGIHLASVVAIRPTGGAISALTDPDGRFRIDGIPPNQYFLYVHPVPPPARAGVAPGDLRLPSYLDGSLVSASGPFQTVFYQGSQATRDSNQALPLTVAAGALLDNINVTLNQTANYVIPSVATYSFFGQTAVRPGYLSGGGTLVASGAGLTSNGSPAPGLNVSFLGGVAALSGGIRAYNGSFLALDLQASLTFGPRHAIFSLPNDIYVLPSGLNMVLSQPPFLGSVTPTLESNGGRSLTLAGSILDAETKFYLDGVPGALLRFDNSGRAVVALPPGLPGVHPVITAFNPDGQNSMFLASGSPVTYTYDSGDPGTASFFPNSLPAGAESMVEITGSSGNFVDGLTMAGVGSSDVQVRRIWVVGPNKIWANVWVAPNAALTAASASVITGFQVISQPFGFQIQGASVRAPVLNSQLANALLNQTAIYPGATVILSGANLSNPTVTVGGLSTTILSSTANQIVFVMPPGLAPGPAILRFSNGVDTAAVVVAIDPVPPNVQNVSGLDSVTIDARRPARPGDVLNVLVAGLTAASASLDSRHIRVDIGGVDHPALEVTPQAGGHRVQVVLSPSVAAGQVPLKVSIDSRSSLPYYLAVQSK